MNENLKQLEKFQTLTGQNNLSRRVPTVEEREIRLKLALEELSELAEAFGLVNTFQILLHQKNNELDVNYGKDKGDWVLETEDTEEYNEVEVLDALLDIAYINNGTIVTCGLQNVFDREFDKVHENNMSKFHLSKHEAELTVNHYLIKTGIEYGIKEIAADFHPFKFYVVLNEHGKVIKPYNFEKVKLNIHE